MRAYHGRTGDNRLPEQDRARETAFTVTENLVVPTFGKANFKGFGPGEYFRTGDQPGTTPFLYRAFTESYAEHFPLKL
jgi:hypothetical protein